MGYKWDEDRKYELSVYHKELKKVTVIAKNKDEAIKKMRNLEYEKTEYCGRLPEVVTHIKCLKKGEME